MQGEQRKHAGRTRPMNNAESGDAAPIECSGTIATGCQRSRKAEVKAVSSIGI